MGDVAYGRSIVQDVAPGGTADRTLTPGSWRGRAATHARPTSHDGTRRGSGTRPMSEAMSSGRQGPDIDRGRSGSETPIEDDTSLRRSRRRSRGVAGRLVDAEEYQSASGRGDPPARRCERPQERNSTRVLATVLFTDIVGSTERQAALGDAVGVILGAITRMVHAEIERWRGAEVDTAGDGFYRDVRRTGPRGPMRARDRRRGPRARARDPGGRAHGRMRADRREGRRESPSRSVHGSPRSAGHRRCSSPRP